MPQFTISQLKAKDANYSPQGQTGVGFLDTDLLFASVGTNTHDLSSVKISMYQLTQDYILTNLALKHGFTITGNVSAQGGLSANGGTGNTINLGDLPASPTGLKTGDLYTAQVKDVIGSGTSTDKILMVK